MEEAAVKESIKRMDFDKMAKEGRKILGRKKKYLRAKARYRHYKKLGHVWGMNKYRKELLGLQDGKDKW